MRRANRRILRPVNSIRKKRFQAEIMLRSGRLFPELQRHNVVRPQDRRSKGLIAEFASILFVTFTRGG